MENKGFTLIEVLIVIAIIGILAAIALPSYQEHVRKGNRIDIQLEMADLSLVAERQYARQNSYPSTTTQTLKFYELKFSAAAATFDIIATPRGSQQGDTCNVMTLNQAGTATPASCW